MKLEVVILAAGQGTRMRSRLPKVLHTVAGRPMLQHVVETALSLQADAVHVVIGHGAEQVREALAQFPLNWVVQSEQLGTGHAVMEALPGIAQDSAVLVLYGDVPLTQADTLRALVAAASATPALLTAKLANPAGYGRILRDEHGALIGVVEHKDATDAQRTIAEINTGVLAAPASLLKTYLPQVGNNNQQGEYYLPDVLSLAVADGLSVASVQAENEIEIQGVNDPLQLSQVEREYQRRQAEALLRDGVCIADPARIDVRGALQCGRDVRIDVNCVFEGVVELGDGVTIGPNCVLKNVTVAADSQIHAMSHLDSAEVGPGCAVGPYARLRPGTRLAAGARIGNFVEVKNTRVGVGSKANHLAYLGDADLGDGVNIGAGTITCNYDGANKHRTELGNNVFVGSNSTLVAPLTVADEGFVGAGSTVTRDVAEGELAVGRAKQRNISGWQQPRKPPESN